MRPSFLLRTFLSHLLISGISLTLVLILSLRTLNQSQYQNVRETLETLGEALSERWAQAADPALFQQELTRIGHRTQTRINLIAPDGRVLQDSEVNAETMENHAQRPEVHLALTGQTGEDIRFSNTTRTQRLYLALPLVRDGKIEGTLRLSRMLRDIHEHTRPLNRNLFWAVLLIFLAALLISWVFSRRISRPLAHLVDVSRRIRAGDLQARAYPSGRAEWGALADAFNQMMDRQHQLIRDLRHRSQELETIISSISEGLLVIDTKDFILLSNPAMNRILDREQLSGRHYWEVCRSSELFDLISEGRQYPGQILRRELTMGERQYQCVLTHLEDPAGTVLTFHDVSEERKLSRMKKDFIINASHELKTPITAIMGFVETLEETAREEDLKYLGIIRRNSTRLVRLVQDMLLLSQLEDQPLRMNRQEVDLEDLCREAAETLRPRAESKGLTWNLDIRNPIPRVPGDPHRLEDLLTNLLDNALRYTDRGGVRLTLKHQQEPAGVLLSVQDSGPGIPREHQDRIFERFYVVDPSRSRERGGTGLGLAIVKHIAQLHGGTITVDSLPGQGTTFTLFLPL